MEIESDNGDKFHLIPNAPILIGRDTKIHTNDRTVSRHKHISLELHNSKSPRVSFEAIGKNPVWVRKSGGGEIRVYRKGERGELWSSDAFSISGKEHVWFRVLESEAVERVDEDEGIGDVEDLELDGGDIAEIDPVKEFGFLVMGHEFDSYSKQMIRDIKKWNWFLEEPNKGSEDDDDDDAARQRRKGRWRKRKKGKHDGQEDDEWEGESEEDKELISKTKKVPTPTYSTRSKNRGKSTEVRTKVKEKSKTQAFKSTSKDEMGNGDDNDDEEDETLGGFIVDNEEEMEDAIGDTGEEEEDEEEEEFDDDEDEDLD